MSIPTAKDMSEISLRKVEAIIATKPLDDENKKVTPTAEQAVFEIKDLDGHYATSGSSATNEDGYLYYRYLLLAGASESYTFSAKPLGDLVNTYTSNETTGNIVLAKNTILDTELALKLKSPVVITAPVDAKVIVHDQAGYYNNVAIPAQETVDNGDGTKTVHFNGGSVWRVSMDGEITKADYVSSREITVDWEGDDRGPDHRAPYNGSEYMDERADDSMVVNVNRRNNLQLNIGDTFTLKCFRIWEIINTEIANRSIQPDFNYNILSGDDVISIEETDVTGGVVGNNWLNITANKSGVAVLEVSYDAIDIAATGSMSFGCLANGFTFNATDPARTALIVVQVGNQASDVNFNIQSNSTSAWDAEIDTLYFCGEKAQLQLSPFAESGSIAKVEVSSNKGGSWTALTADAEGMYTADIYSGNNIIRVTKDDGTQSYQCVRGDKIAFTISEVSGHSNKNGVIDPGEQIKIHFQGVHNAIGKMSGIYNPTGYTTHYTMAGKHFSSGVGQYTYPARANIVVTVPGTASDGESFALTQGYTTFGGWGGSAGSHRGVTEGGGANTNADGISGANNMFPTLTLTIGQDITDVNSTINGSTGSNASDVTLGDVNADGVVDAADAALTYAIHNNKMTATDDQLEAADVNGDGAVDAADAALIYAYHNGKITQFPAEEN